MTVYPREKLEAQLWPRVDRSRGSDGCWLWTGGTNGVGYGMVYTGERSRLVHRVVYSLEHGPIPDGLMVRHRCDRRRCCNPSHLVLGTAAENTADMQQRGRHAGPQPVWKGSPEEREDTRLFPRLTTDQRFWLKVEKGEECWTWTGQGSFGYGKFSRGGHWLWAHRVSWEMAHGPIPAGMYVCHRCDNRACVRPDHLFIGTSRDNHQDMMNKGRGNTGDKNGSRTHPEMYRGAEHWTAKRPELIRHGEDAPMTKLKECDAQAILDSVGNWPEVRAAAAAYGVDPITVYDIWQRRTWKHLQGESLSHPLQGKTEQDRFWEKIDASDDDGCWPWTAAHTSRGVPVFHFRGHDTSARRVAYILTYRDLPPTEIVRARCKNKGCCRPDHLFVQTVKDWRHKTP